MIPRNLDNDRRGESLAWEDLTAGIPTIVALAKLCSNVLSNPNSLETKLDNLGSEGRAILFAARKTGSISIRGDKNAFEPGERFLAICVELDEGRRLEFRCPDNPEQTIRFVDGFRELCCQRLIMHQLMNEFSLSSRGFDLANQIDPESVAELLQMGRETV